MSDATPQGPSPAESGAPVQEQPGAFGQERGEGSAVPCDVPIRWRIDQVDERFGLTAGEAEGAVRMAGILWEEAVGRALFRWDDKDGLPIRFVYDERQEDIQNRVRAQEELDESARRIQEARHEMETRWEEGQRALAAHHCRLQDYLEGLERHWEEVKQWNRRGGAPEEERNRLEEAREALDRERRTLDTEAREVTGLMDRLNTETEHLNSRIRDHNRTSARFHERFPPSAVQSGIFRETLRTLGDRTTSVEREIRIYQFEDRDHLILVLAHELGHALGLGHSGVAGSVMVDVAGPRSSEGRTPRLTPSDLELLRSRCPHLFRPTPGFHHHRP